MATLHRLYQLVDAIPEDQRDEAVRLLQGLLVSAQGPPPDTDFAEALVRSIGIYHDTLRLDEASSVYRDPFMRWFQQAFGEARPETLWARVLTILIDARFNQMGMAERALANTKLVHLARLDVREDITLEDIPDLKAPKLKSRENAFSRACPP